MIEARGAIKDGKVREYLKQEKELSSIKNCINNNTRAIRESSNRASSVATTGSRRTGIRRPSEIDWAHYDLATRYREVMNAEYSSEEERQAALAQYKKEEETEQWIEQVDRENYEEALREQRRERARHMSKDTDNPVVCFALIVEFVILPLFGLLAIMF